MNNKSNRYDNMLELLGNCKNISEFLYKLKTKFRNITDKKYIDNICNDFLLKYTDSFYNECYVEFISSNFLNEDLWCFYKKDIEIMKLNLQKKLFKNILLYYKDEQDINKYPTRWFYYIYQKLGDPYDPANVRWDQMEDAKDIFRRWNISANMISSLKK